MPCPLWNRSSALCTHYEQRQRQTCFTGTRIRIEAVEEKFEYGKGRYTDSLLPESSPMIFITIWQSNRNERSCRPHQATSPVEVDSGMRGRPPRPIPLGRGNLGPLHPPVRRERPHVISVAHPWLGLQRRRHHTVSGATSSRNIPQLHAATLSRGRPGAH